MSEIQTSEDAAPAGCGLFFGWLAANMLGASVGWVLGWQASYVIPGLFSTAALGGVTGFFLGALQWLVLRGHMSKSGWWIPATTIGWAAGFGLGVSVAQRLDLVGAAFGLVVGAFTGTLLGLLQWLVLYRRASRAVLWVPVTIFAWASSLIYYQPGVTWLGLMYGTLSGLVSGIAILWILYRPSKE